MKSPVRANCKLSLPGPFEAAKLADVEKALSFVDDMTRTNAIFCAWEYATRAGGCDGDRLDQGWVSMIRILRTAHECGPEFKAFCERAAQIAADARLFDGHVR